MPARKTDPFEKLCQEIAVGQFDEHLTDIAAALGERADAAGIAGRWHLKAEGIDVDQDDLTMQMLDLVKQRTNVEAWSLTQAALIASGDVRRAVIAAVLHFRDGLLIEDADARVDTMKVTALMDGIEVRQVDPPNASPSS